MNWKVKFKQELYNELDDYLFDVAPSENGCFLLANSLEGILFVTDIIYPQNKDWVKIDDGLCEPSPIYMSYASNLADTKAKALIFVHSHPREFHPSSFSYIDVISNEKMFANLSEMVEQPIASLVFSRKGVHGVVYSNSKQHDISDYSVLSRQLENKLGSEETGNVVDEEELDRQILFMKKSGVMNLSNINIAIIGLGGIGSPLAVMLAKMGVQSMTFFDGDKIEKHNLPRIQGANLNSIGKYKANVVRDYVETFSCTRVEVQLEMLKYEKSLSQFDLIFGCVDNHTARDVMNTAAYKYAIPYIDSACAIPLSDNDSVEQAVIAVNTVMPDSPCLWCSNTLNGINIMEEALTDEELKQRKEDGYLMSVSDAPSVISLTTSVASMAINRMLNLLGIYTGEYSDKVIFDFNSTLLNESNFVKSERCQCSTQSAFR